MKTNLKKVKSVITKSNLPDADYVINPYIGCQHSCIYCYADFMKRFTGHNSETWGSFVDIKTNARETITPNSIKENSLILIGSVTDPYQQSEVKYGVTRDCLEKLLEYQPNLEILTKSHLILRDIDLLKQFKNLRVGISLGILDNDLSRKIEPFAPSPKRRLETLKKLKEEGIKTYLFISPIFPEITDFEKIIKESEGNFGEVLFENLNIRSNNRENIFSFLSDNKQNLIPLYEEIQTNKDYWNELEKEISEYCKKNKIPYKIYFNHGK